MTTQENIEEIYRLIREIEKNEIILQRILSERLGYSLSKVNYLPRV
jgi:N-acetylglutamate synthase-like GNAT family acetyltransferase